MPPYRLQTLLEIRERAEEAAKQAFSEASQALAKEQKELKRLEEDLERRKVERKAKVLAYLDEVMKKASGGPGGLTMMNRYEERLKDEEAQVALEIDRQKELVKVAEEKLEVCRQEMTTAAMELKAIEKHKDKWRIERKVAREQHEEAAGEEIGNALFLARQRKAGDV